MSRYIDADMLCRLLENMDPDEHLLPDEVIGMTYDTRLKVLKRCPFCGGRAKAEQLDDGQIVVYCKNEACIGSRLFDAIGYRTYDDAIDAWNERPDDGKI